MKDVRKRDATDAYWRDLIANIETYCSRAELDMEVENARRVLSQQLDKGLRLAVSYSGGKDGRVVADIAEKLGVRQGISSVCPHLDYPFWLRHLAETTPDWVTTRTFDNLDHDFLRKHPAYIFAMNPVPFWERSHWLAQNEFFKTEKLDMLITGRRVSDDNFCGGGYIVANKTKTVINPLRDWEHRHIIAYFHYNEIPLPVWYETEGAFEDGAICWIEENTANVRRWNGDLIGYQREALRRVGRRCEETFAIASALVEETGIWKRPA